MRCSSRTNGSRSTCCLSYIPTKIIQNPMENKICFNKVKLAICKFCCRQVTPLASFSDKSRARGPTSVPAKGQGNLSVSERTVANELSYWGTWLKVFWFFFRDLVQYVNQNLMHRVAPKAGLELGCRELKQDKILKLNYQSPSHVSH